MRARRFAVVATATVSAFLLAAPGALAGSDRSTTEGSDVSCSLTDNGKTLTCAIRDTKGDGHTAAMEYRVKQGERLSVVMTEKNQNDNTTRSVTKRYGSTVKVYFRAVRLKTSANYGPWKTIDSRIEA